MTTTAATTSAPMTLPPDPGTASAGGDALVAPTVGGGTTTVPTSATAPDATTTTGGGQTYLSFPLPTTQHQSFRDAFIALAFFDAAARLGAGRGGWVFGPAQGGAQHAIYQLPGQQPLQKQPGQVPAPPSAIGGGVVGDVTLDEGMLNAVTLKSEAGNSVKVWGDPHVEFRLDGKFEKFDIGYGPGAITLNDGTRISWDTATKQNVLNDFRIQRPGAALVEVNTRDHDNETNVETGLTDSQLREFAAELRNYEGKAHKPLKRIGGAPTQGGGAVLVPVQVPTQSGPPSKVPAKTNASFTFG